MKLVMLRNLNYSCRDGGGSLVSCASLALIIKEVLAQ